MTFKFMLTSLLLFTLPIMAIQVKVNSGKYSDYYHIKYELTSGQYKVNSDYGFNKGGQFEVLVPKQYFPIDAPNCKNDIIIRMPYSENEEIKRKLYDDLVSAKNAVVTLELNPYVNVLKKEPLKLELEYCNVFFRQRSGDYYDQL